MYAQLYVPPPSLKLYISLAFPFTCLEQFLELSGMLFPGLWSSFGPQIKQLTTLILCFFFFFQSTGTCRLYAGGIAGHQGVDPACKGALVRIRAQSSEYQQDQGRIGGPFKWGTWDEFNEWVFLQRYELG